MSSESHMPDKGHSESSHHRKRSSCVPPLIASSEREEANLRRVDWISKQWKMHPADPRLSTWVKNAAAVRVGDPQLLGNGIELVPSADFPAGTRPEDLANYPEILRAFSRTFGPNLFAELSLADPFSTGWPYWSNFFFKITPNTATGLLRVNVHKCPCSGPCLGVTGEYLPGSNMWFYDCTSEDDIFHEIGHAVMDDGILQYREPLYFKYATGGLVAAGGQPQFLDAKVMIETWFGKKIDSGKDIDGVDIGFVSDYATPTSHTTKDAPREDFAETFKYYVYSPSKLFEKISRQIPKTLGGPGSVTLSNKAYLISELYKGLWFQDGGVAGGWPGFSI